jgi:predicted nucleic acid-binding protein
VPDQYQRPYLDSSVFIGWLWDETRNGINRKEVATHIFKLAERGVFRIYVCAFTMAEVHKKWKLPTLTNEQDEKLLAFFEHEYIEVVDVDYEIGEQANRFCREYGLRPADAVHLACALRAGCDVLLAWDGDFDRVTRPDIRIEEPRVLGQLDLPEADSND